MKAMLTNWSIMRALRLLLSIAVLVQAMVLKDFTVGLLGTFLLSIVLAYIGCFGASSCILSSKQNKRLKQIEYEKMDSSK